LTSKNNIDVHLTPQSQTHNQTHHKYCVFGGSSRRFWKKTLVCCLWYNKVNSPVYQQIIRISIFLEYFDIIKLDGVSIDVMRLRLFPFSLRDEVRTWLPSMHFKSIKTWDELKQMISVMLLSSHSWCDVIDFLSWCGVSLVCIDKLLQIQSND